MLLRVRDLGCTYTRKAFCRGSDSCVSDAQKRQLLVAAAAATGAAAVDTPQGTPWAPATPAAHRAEPAAPLRPNPKGLSGRQLIRV